MVIEGGVVIYNPTAGRGGAGRSIDEAKAMLGPSFEWRPTLRAGHATELAAEATKTHDVVVAFGGDGTVGDVARGIIGTGATLGILPGGTGNDYARNLGLRLDLKEATATVLAGVVAKVDYGTLNGTPFINNAGAGFDARVMQVMNTSIRFATGKMAFNLAIAKTLPFYKAFNLTLEIDDAPPITERAMMVSILNGRMYGGGMLAAPTAEVDDGYLDAMVVKAVSKPQLIAVAMAVQNGNHVGNSAVTMHRFKRMKITTTPTGPLNIDGDIRGLTPADIQVQPRGLKVLVR